MVKEAQLSYTDQKGYYGLRVNPTYEEMLHSLKKEVRIRSPIGLLNGTPWAPIARFCSSRLGNSTTLRGRTSSTMRRTSSYLLLRPEGPRLPWLAPTTSGTGRRSSIRL